MKGEKVGIVEHLYALFFIFLIVKKYFTCNNTSNGCVFTCIMQTDGQDRLFIAR